MYTFIKMSPSFYNSSNFISFAMQNPFRGTPLSSFHPI
uniref:Uncharacterized protein n=1 Tax=Lepeophtheirus salmonis TaxID=72036 RepID=A0A0K2TZB7_LEPSM